MNDTPNREYKDVAGNVVSLDWLVRNEPEWAANQIRHRDILERELGEAQYQMKQLRLWLNACIEMKDRVAEEVTSLRAEVERLKRGEFICPKCGLRKDSDHAKGDF